MYMHKYIFQYKAYFDITISNKIAISVASTSICNDSLQIFILNQTFTWNKDFKILLTLLIIERKDYQTRHKYLTIFLKTRE